VRQCEICGCELCTATHAICLKYGLKWTCPRCEASYYSGWITGYQLILTGGPYWLDIPNNQYFESYRPKD